MMELFAILRRVVFLALFMAAIAKTKAQTEELCKLRNTDNPGPPVPDLVMSYSAKVQINFESHNFTTEYDEAVAYNISREVWTGGKHVKYIELPKQDMILIIVYGNTGPTCTVAELLTANPKVILQEIDSGALSTAFIITSAIRSSKVQFYSRGPFVHNGMYIQEWEMCSYIPSLETNVSMKLFFTANSWTPYYPVHVRNPELSVNNTLVQAEVKAKGGKLEKEIAFTVNYFRYLPYIPSPDNFQAPEDVHCPGYGADIEPPPFPDYFSYQSEIIVYQGSAGEENSIVSYRSVYYDFKSGISRIDFQDPFSESQDSSAPLTAKVRSIIHDFNTGVQYTIDPVLGTCDLRVIDVTFGAVTATDTLSDVMLTPKQFFSMDGVSLSYNGKYKARGLMADVFSGVVQTKTRSRIYHWYFTTDRSQLIENQQVEKKVLIKLVSRPQSITDKQGPFEINFYNFVDEQPDVFTYDISSCYNESQSKVFVVKFPGHLNEFLSDYTSVLKSTMHQMIQDTAGVSPQRIYIQQFYFRSPYFFVQFKLLESPPIKGMVLKPVPSDNPLKEAEDLLRKAVSEGSFMTTIHTNSSFSVPLKALPDGLREFSSESAVVIEEGYKEGSVIGLSVGMIILGVLLGGVIVNILISRKFGVSLLQQSGYGSGPNSFPNPLTESTF